MLTARCRIQECTELARSLNDGLAHSKHPFTNKLVKPYQPLRVSVRFPQTVS